MDGVSLGMPGPWADNNREAADIYTTKIGGLPDWPFPIDSEKPDLVRCSKCESNLSLIAQIYAPISRKSWSIDERVIYIFGCLVPRCTSFLWRALRVQKIKRTEVVPVPESSRSVSNNNSNLLGDPWSFDIKKENGQENDDDDDDDEDDEDDEDDIDLEELGRALSEAGYFKSTGKKQNNDAESSRKPSPQPTCLPARSTDDTPVMPCFYIYTQKEKLSKQVTSGSSKHSRISIQESENNPEDHSDGETYAEENYEYDRALNADRTYLKFKKRVDLYPEQCFRYSYGGKPLLASGEVGDPGACRLCGGTRLYEMQLMAPLIYFLQEAADDQQRISLEKMDWMTLLVYTCPKSCADSSYQAKSSSGEWIVAEEAVNVQYE